MSQRLRGLSRGLAAAALLAAAVSAHAADAVTDAMQAAYAPYRAALFRTNSQAQAEAEQAMAQAQTAWQGVRERFARERPPPYDRDAGFAATLQQVSTVYERAAQQVRDKRLPEAHETLEEVRDLLADLRRRNGVVVFSDHMNAYHEEMEHVLGEGAKLLAQPQGAMRLMARVGTLGYLAGRLRSEAPAALSADADFATLVQAVQGSVAALEAALLAQDEAAVKAALGKLKAPYSRLFLKFG